MHTHLYVYVLMQNTHCTRVLSVLLHYQQQVWLGFQRHVAWCLCMYVQTHVNLTYKRIFNILTQYIHIHIMFHYYEHQVWLGIQHHVTWCICVKRYGYLYSHTHYANNLRTHKCYIHTHYAYMLTTCLIIINTRCGSAFNATLPGWCMPVLDEPIPMMTCSKGSQSCSSLPAVCVCVCVFVSVRVCVCMCVCARACYKPICMVT